MNKENVFKWYIITVPIKKEEYFFNQITEIIKENRFENVGPCILPTNSFLKSESGEVKKQTDKLRGFIFIKTQILTTEQGQKIPTDELQKLLNHFPKLKLIYNEPFDDKELERVLHQNNKKDNKEEYKRVISGFAKGCFIKKIIKEKKNNIFETEIESFGRSIIIDLTKEELGNK